VTDEPPATDSISDVATDVTDAPPVTDTITDPGTDPGTDAGTDTTDQPTDSTDLPTDTTDFPTDTTSFCVAPEAGGAGGAGQPPLANSGNSTRGQLLLALALLLGGAVITFGGYRLNRRGARHIN